MKNVFKKAVSLTVALSTVAALSVSAFAATAEYNKTDVAVEVSDYATTADGQYAVAVVPAGLETYTDADIYYVNQADQTAIVGIVESMLVKGALADGDYEVRIGNNAGVDLEVIPFTVSSTPAGVQITLNYGDVDGDGEVGSADASSVLQKRVNLIAGFTDTEGRAIPETVGDVDGDGEVGSADASSILQKRVNLITDFTDASGNILSTYTYTYVAPTE